MNECETKPFKDWNFKDYFDATPQTWFAEGSTYQYLPVFKDHGWVWVDRGKFWRCDHILAADDYDLEAVQQLPGVFVRRIS